MKAMLDTIDSINFPEKSRQKNIESRQRRVLHANTDSNNRGVGFVTAKWIKEANETTSSNGSRRPSQVQRDAMQHMASTISIEPDFDESHGY